MDRRVRPLHRFWLASLLVGSLLMNAACTSGAPTAVDGMAAGANDAGPVPDTPAPAVMPEAVSPPAPELSALQAEFEEYLAGYEGTFGIYLVDVRSGASLGINADTAFPAASTFRLPLAMYVLSRAARGEVGLSEAIDYEPSDWEEGTGILQGEVGPDFSLPIRTLLDYSIRYSDNIATNTLPRRFGKQNVIDYLGGLGGTVWSYDEMTNGTTPREMGQYLLQAATERSAIGSRRLQRMLLDLLASTAFTDRIPAGLPEGVRVEHKIGTLPGTVNDVAFVHAPERPFVLSVFSLDVPEETAIQVISALAERAYSFLNPGPSGV